MTNFRNAMKLRTASETRSLIGFWGTLLNFPRQSSRPIVGHIKKYLAAGDDESAETIRKAKGGEFSFDLDDFTKKLSRGHAMLGDSHAYREKDLTDIREHIATTRGYFFDFKFILNWRVHGFQPEKRSELFAQLSRKLGLPQPTVS
jgi:hypothetical protein